MVYLKGNTLTVTGKDAEQIEQKAKRLNMPAKQFLKQSIEWAVTKFWPASHKHSQHCKCSLSAPYICHLCQRKAKEKKRDK